MRKVILIVAVTLGLGLLVTERLNATLITRGFTGTVTSWIDIDNSGTNIWGLGVGDSFTGSIVYDDAGITGIGDEIVDLGTGSTFGSGLSLLLGSQSYTEQDESGFAVGFPKAHFSLGILSFVDFLAQQTGFIVGLGGTRSMIAKEFQVDALTGSYTFTPVPEPTTIALLGIGLAGLAGAEVRRRRKKKAVDKS